MVPLEESDGFGVVKKLVEVSPVFLVDKFVKGLGIVEVGLANEEIVVDSWLLSSLGHLND